MIIRDKERERKGRGRTKAVKFFDIERTTYVAHVSYCKLQAKQWNCWALIFAFFSTTTSTIRRKNVERNAQQVTFLEDQNPGSTRCGPRRYAVISIKSPALPLFLVTPFEASRRGMVQPYMRTPPVQDVDLGGTALSPSLPLCLTPFEASHQEMVQSEIRKAAQDVDLGGMQLSPSNLQHFPCL